MTALSDALAVAQARAVAAVSKAYVAGALDDPSAEPDLSETKSAAQPAATTETEAQ